MSKIVWGEGSRLRKLGRSMDAIGWRKFIEGMISRETLEVQAACVDLEQCTLSLNNWAKGLVVKLMEITHGQWLYRNVLVQDEICGVEAAKRKELLQIETEGHIELEGNDPACLAPPLLLSSICLSISSCNRSFLFAASTPQISSCTSTFL